MTLLDAAPQTHYVIRSIAGEGFARRRLLDMGFVKKSRIFVAGRAPFCGAVLVSLRGSLIALRADAAATIELGAV
ncbi:MAG: ferrous iron transport protein A [Clostridiales bacterium]|nr:ferrous iron transport protein A [Clostridiales bacterium]